MVDEKAVAVETKEGNYQTFGKHPEDDDKDPNEYTVSDAIEHIGFGRFQLLTACASGFAWVADGMEIMVLSILGPTLLCEWNLTTWQEAFITTVVFVGFLIGSPFFGFFADKFGRRRGLLFSSIWISFFGVLSACAPLLGWLYFLRFLVGFGVGGGPQAVTYFAEFLPNKARGRAVMCVEVFWALGGAFEVVLAILILEPYGWQWWLGVSAFPSLIFVVCCIWLPNSPRYCMATGDSEGAMKTLKLAAKMNKTTLPEGTLIPEPVVPRGRVMDLFSPKLRMSSLLLSGLWFSAAFSYYGVVLFTTEMIKQGTTCSPNDFDEALGDGTGNKTTAECVELTLDDYYSLLWTSFAELPGLLIAGLLIDPLGRRYTLLVLYLLYSLVCFLLFICMGTVPMVFLLFVCRAFIASAFQVLYVYTPEVYPTEVRALSVGLGSGFGRLGAIVTPYVAEVLIDLSLWYGLSVYACIGFVSAIIAFLLPIETAGQTLKEAGEDRNGKDAEEKGTQMLQPTK